MVFITYPFTSLQSSDVSDVRQVICICKLWCYDKLRTTRITCCKYHIRMVY